MVLIQDNKILSVEFFPDEKKLIVKTERTILNGTEYVNIIFLDIYAYSFKDFEEENVIDEVAESSLLGFLNWYYSNDHSQTRSVMEYNLPLPFVDKVSALNTLAEIYKYYEINACIGMDGWIIAKQWKIVHSQ